MLLYRYSNAPSSGELNLRPQLWYHKMSVKHLHRKIKLPLRAQVYEENVMKKCVQLLCWMDKIIASLISSYKWVMECPQKGYHLFMTLNGPFLLAKPCINYVSNI